MAAVWSPDGGPVGRRGYTISGGKLLSMCVLRSMGTGLRPVEDREQHHVQDSSDHVQRQPSIAPTTTAQRLEE